MELEDKVRWSSEQLVQRIRQQTEQEVRGFVNELLATTRERATARDEDSPVAGSELQRALWEEGVRVRAEVEQIWAARLDEADAAAKQRLQLQLRTAREEADRQLAEQVAGIRAEGQRVLEAALDVACQEADRALARRVGEVRAEVARTATADLAGAPAPAGPETDEILSRVLDGVRRLDEVSRLGDALDTLAELAGNEASRAAVLTVHDTGVRGWRFIGFEPALEPARRVALELGDAGIVGGAVITGESRAIVSGQDGVPGDAEPAFTTLPAGTQALALPVHVGGQVMAVVYGDDAERRPTAAWREALELLTRHAGYCLEALTAARAAQLALHGAGSLIPEDTPHTLPFDETDAECSGPEG